MYLCDDCGAVVEEPETGREEAEHFGTPCYITNYVCPACGGTDLHYACSCVICGEFAIYDDLLAGVCPKCGQDINNKFERDLLHMTRNYGRAELKYLKEALDIWDVREAI